MAILLVGVAGVNRVPRVHVVPGGAPLLLSNEFLKDSVAILTWDVDVCSLRSWECGPW